jgi:hypothetical protein
MLRLPYLRRLAHCVEMKTRRSDTQHNLGSQTERHANIKVDCSSARITAKN